MVAKAATGIRNMFRNNRSYNIHIHKHEHDHVSLLESSIPWHLAFVFLIPLLIDVLQVHCQGQGVSPFKTHMPNMLAFLLAILVYCFALVCYIKSKLHPKATAPCSELSAQVALISGFLASASAISVLLSGYFEAVPFIIWFFLSTCVARNLIMRMGQWLNCSFRNVISYIYSMWKGITGTKTERLPV